MPRSVTSTDVVGKNEVDIWSHDALKRSEIAKDLSERLANAETPLCVAIEGRYGSGKTFLLTGWHQSNESHGIPSIYFNAWENEFTDDPLTSFMSQILLDCRDNPTLAEKVKGAMKQVGGVLATRALPILAKGVANQIFGTKAVDEILESVNIEGEEIAKAFADFAEERLAAHVAARESSNHFKQAFAELISDLSEGKGPVFVFVDELDRCRPTYAVSFIEDIRHLLSVNNCIFVVGVDERQMKATIQSVYGNETDSGGYLRKIFDWSYKLPGMAALSYCRHLIEKRIFLADFTEVDGAASASWVPEHVAFAADLLNLQLRDIEHVLRRIEISTQRIPSKHAKFANIAAFMCAAEMQDSPLLRQMLRGHDIFERYIENNHSEALSLALANNEENRFVFNFIKAACATRAELHNISNSRDEALQNAAQQVRNLINRYHIGDDNTLVRYVNRYLSPPGKH